MKILTFNYYKRYLDNYKPFLNLARTKGDVVRNILLPFWQEDLFPLGQLKHIVDKHIEDFKPDVIILGDCLNYPTSAIYNLVEKRVPVIGFQHGLAQTGNYTNCDYYFNWKKVGLPKLEQIKWLQDFKENYILFLGNADGTSDKIKTLLTEMTKLPGLLKVVFKPHPEEKFYYENTLTKKYDGVFLKEKGVEIAQTDDTTLLIGNARYVVGGGTSAGLKALIMGKPFAVIPSGNRNVYPSFLHCGWDIDSVIQVWENQPKDKINDFLMREINDYKRSTEIFYGEIKEIVSNSGKECNNSGRQP